MLFFFFFRFIGAPSCFGPCVSRCCRRFNVLCILRCFSAHHSSNTEWLSPLTYLNGKVFLCAHLPLTRCFAFLFIAPLRVNSRDLHGEHENSARSAVIETRQMFRTTQVTFLPILMVDLNVTEAADLTIFHALHFCHMTG